MKLNHCPYCKGLPQIHTHEDRNVIGTQGYTCTIRCVYCKRSISVFNTDEKIAEEKAVEYWNKCRVFE